MWLIRASYFWLINIRGIHGDFFFAGIFKTCISWHLSIRPMLMWFLYRSIFLGSFLKSTNSFGFVLLLKSFLSFKFYVVNCVRIFKRDWRGHQAKDRCHWFVVHWLLEMARETTVNKRRCCKDGFCGGQRQWGTASSFLSAPVYLCKFFYV